MKTFEYKDVDIVVAPEGWYEARLQNRLEEGYEIFRDEAAMSWKGFKNNKELYEKNAL